MTRIRRVETEREQEKLVDEFITKGYKLEQQGQHSARLKAKEWGDLPVHGFLFLFAFIAGAAVADAANISAGGAWVIALLANVVYAGYSWFTAEEVVIKIANEKQ